MDMPVAFLEGPFLEDLALHPSHVGWLMWHHADVGRWPWALPPPTPLAVLSTLHAQSFLSFTTGAPCRLGDSLELIPLSRHALCLSEVHHISLRHGRVGGRPGQSYHGCLHAPKSAASRGSASRCVVSAWDASSSLASSLPPSPPRLVASALRLLV